MRITNVEAIVLKAPVAGIDTWQAASFAMPFEYAETTLVRIETDEGVSGWGEAHAPVAPEVAKSIIDHLITPAIQGKDPRQFASLWDHMYTLMRPRGHALGFTMEAISGVDIALLDIAGQAAGMPAHRLFGGAHRTRVRTYTSILPWMDPEPLAATALKAVEAGSTAIKIKVGQDHSLDKEKARAVRQAVGPNIDLMADANCRYSASEALKTARTLEEQGFVWLEEPVPPEDVAGYSGLRSKVDIAIAGGECEATHYRFAELFSRGAYDVAQPDICRAGGLTACHRIGVLAQAHNVRVAPHASIGSAIHLAAGLQWAASAPAVWIYELPSFQNPLVDDLFEQPLTWRDGHLDVPMGNGLGIQVREDIVDRYRVA